MPGLRKISIGLALLANCASAFAGWEYSQSSDPFNEADRSSVTASAEMYAHGDVPLVIGFKCMEDGLNVVLLHTYLGGDSDDEVRVQLRVDKKEPYGPKNWALFPGKEASWMPIRDVPKMVNQMQAGDQLHIRVIDPLDGETLTQLVSLNGLSSAISKLSCHED